ncbi:hypothetical protein ElyMa_003229900 [Elysia marginata]|uniref:Uncharacterized protein n=1 Tax=Elysia marginata TaxID=1093978 RepID=A0AAV4J3X5_9GAST|nr:hypothetical protein ElyMa_003229900 [Elysia marginata]
MKRRNAPEGCNEDPRTAPTEVHVLSSADAGDNCHNEETAVSESPENVARLSDPNTQSKSNKQANERANKARLSKKQTTLDMFKSGGRSSCHVVRWPPDGGPARPLYLLPPAALTGPGEGGRFGCIKTIGDNGHPRGSALNADPRSVSISPLSESSGAGALGGGWEGGDRLEGGGGLSGRAGSSGRGGASAALKASSAASTDWKDTAEFVEQVLQLWKVLNCKSPSQSDLLNDPDRVPVDCVNTKPREQSRNMGQESNRYGSHWKCSYAIINERHF